MKLNIHKCSYYDEFVSFTSLDENGWYYRNNYNITWDIRLFSAKLRSGLLSTESFIKHM